MYIMASAANMVISGVDYSVEKHLHYTQPKINDRGSKNVNILNKMGMKSTLLSTPLMLTWGVNTYTDDSTGKTTYDLALQFPSAEYPNPEAESFLENLKALESQIKSDAIKNSKEWFNKTKMSEDVVDALWTPMLRYPKDKATQEPDYTRAPTLKVKIPYWNDTWNTEVFNTKGEVMFPSSDHPEDTPVTLVPKGSKIATIIKNGGLWFANGKFGTTWKLEQVVVQPRATLKGTCHIPLNDHDRKEIENQVIPDQDDDSHVDSQSPKQNVSVHVNDSDDEDGGENSNNVEEEPVAAPPVTKKKRVVKKKTAANDED